MPLLNKGEYCFKDDHPGKWYFCIKKTKKMRVPKLSMPKRIICNTSSFRYQRKIQIKKVFKIEIIMQKCINTVLSILRQYFFFSQRRWMLVGEMTRHLTTKTPLIFFVRRKENTQNMQDNMQAKEMLNQTVSTQNDKN